jgi:hypothetical protein
MKQTTKSFDIIWMTVSVIVLMLILDSGVIQYVLRSILGLAGIFSAPT